MTKVLLVGKFSEGAFAHMIYDVGKKDLNWKIQTLDPDYESYQGKKIQDIDEKFDLLCRAFEPDVIFTLKPRMLSASAIAKQSAKKVCWWLDNAKRFIDFSLYNESHDKMYLCESDQGYPWMAIGINPRINRPIADKDKKWNSDIVFVGTGHQQRMKPLVKILTTLPYSVKLWGNNWNRLIFENTGIEYMGGAIYWENMMKAYTMSNIIFNIHYEKGITPNMRCIEAPSSGTLLLSDTGNGIESCLKKGDEFVAYDTIKEARYLIGKYLEEDEERQRIAKNGYRRVYKDHLLKDKLLEMIK